MDEAKTPFDPSRYLTKVGGNDYLEVKWRLLWVRDQHPDTVIETEAIKVIPSLPDPETGALVGWALFKATVTIPGLGSASGHGSESYNDFREYVEKAETKAIGRALGALGFGTQFAGDEFGGGIVDSPVNRPNPSQPRPQQPQSQPARPQQQYAQQGETKTFGDPNRPVSPAQIKYIRDLIAQQNENPDDFSDVINMMNNATASSWIAQLKIGDLPWLSSSTAGVDPNPKVETPAVSPDEALRAVLRLDQTKGDQQKHWAHWIAAAGDDPGKWRNLARQANHAVHVGGDKQGWRYTMLAMSAPNDDILFGLQEMAEKQAVYSPEMEANLNFRLNELHEGEDGDGEDINS